MAVGAVFQNTQHGSKIPSDVLEALGVNDLAVFSGLKAMVYVVVNERPLGIGHRLFNRMKLLCDVSAGAALGYHLDNRGKVSIGPFQSG